MTNAEIVAWINAQPWGVTKKNAALSYATGIVWSCKVGISVLADVTQARNNRGRYETEFNNHPDYAPIKAVWRQVETAGGLPVGALDCFRWQGDPPGRTCCFRRTNAQCEADATAKGITSAALTVRRAGGRAD